MARLTTYNVVICMIVAIGTFGYGYGFGVFITSIGQPGFYKDFNLDRQYFSIYARFEILTLTIPQRRVITRLRESRHNPAFL